MKNRKNKVPNWKIKNKNVVTMYEKLKIHGNSEAIDFSNCSDEDKAIFRFVEEIFNAEAIKWHTRTLWTDFPDGGDVEESLECLHNC